MHILWSVWSERIFMNVANVPTNDLNETWQYSLQIALCSVELGYNQQKIIRHGNNIIYSPKNKFENVWLAPSSPWGLPPSIFDAVQGSSGYGGLRHRVGKCPLYHIQFCNQEQRKTSFFKIFNVVFNGFTNIENATLGFLCGKKFSMNDVNYNWNCFICNE